MTRALLTHEGRKSYIKATQVIKLQDEEILRLLTPDEAAALVQALEQLTP